MTLGSYYNALNDPYIHINAQMIEKPEISYSISIPIHFKGRYSLSYNGSTGDCGARGHDANNVEVYVSRVDFPRGENNLLHIQRILG